jgi:hypothetical protein
MRGYGLTVFSGTVPEKFPVEVISTLHSFRPNQDLILIKTPHPRLEVTRTVAGMSGSPIYVSGKVVGAYAYGWLFGTEAIAGVTPIKSMLDELARTIPSTLFPRIGGPLLSSGATASGQPNPPPRRAHAFVGSPDAYDLRLHAKQMAARSALALAPPPGTSLAAATTPVLLGGAGNLAVGLASALLTPLGLEPLQAGGGRSDAPALDAPTSYVDGGALGVELVRGDISALALGTVTRIVGNKLVAFGHPMLGGGVEALPTAIGKVHWIVATQNRSFKIGEAVRSLGTLVNDRQAAIVVDASVKAPTFPLRVEILGVDRAPKRVWNMEVTQDQFLAPSLAAMALGNALEETTAERQDTTWRAVSKIKVRDYGLVTVADFGAGSGNPLGPDEVGHVRVIRALGALLNNTWEQVTIEGVEITVRMAFDREVSLLRGAKVLEPELDSGRPARIQLTHEPYQGKVETRVIEVNIPTELAGHDVEIELAPGYEVERPLATPDSVADLVSALPRSTFDPESVVAMFRLRETAAAYKGKVASRLPPGALDALRSSSQSDGPEVFGAQAMLAVPLGRFITGHDTVRVAVRSVLR